MRVISLIIFPVAFPAETNLLHELSALVTHGWASVSYNKFSSAPGRAWNPPREAPPLSRLQHLAAPQSQSRPHWTLTMEPAPRHERHGLERVQSEPRPLLHLLGNFY